EKLKKPSPVDSRDITPAALTLKSPLRLRLAHRRGDDRPTAARHNEPLTPSCGTSESRRSAICLATGRKDRVGRAVVGGFLPGCFAQFQAEPDMGFVVILSETEN